MINYFVSYKKDEKDKFKNDLKLRIYNWSVRLVKYLRILSKQEKDEAVKTIVNQLLRSGTSIGANYIEAIGSPTKKDFRNFLAYSLKSCNESKYWLSLMKDTGIDEGKEFNFLLDEAVEISKILGKSVSTLYKEKK
ncbi:MAG: four helix bundle protein [Candidatus Magasanikbacteria bacterium]|nr:four helix bundle protein [Candidatus Magasanikbacteria bacterium]